MKKRRANVIRKKPVRIHPIPDSCVSKTTTTANTNIEGQNKDGAMDVAGNVPETDSRLNVLQCRNFIYESLTRNGKINLLKEHLSDILRLSGWNRIMNEGFMEYIKNESLDNINISHILCDMVPFGREQVPPAIRESMRDIFRSIAQKYLSIDDSKSPLPLQDKEEPSDTYLPFEYQTRDKIPDYGDQSVFAQPLESSVPSPSDHLPLSETVVPSPSFVENTTTNSPSSLTRDLGVIVLLDRVDREKDNDSEKLEREKPEQREKERQEKDRLRQELEKERQECQERERQEQRDRERQEQKERERHEQKERERQEQKERERQEHRERERQEQKERERQEQKERERQEQKERERQEQKEQKERERHEQKERERHEQKERERHEQKERERHEHKERRERHNQHQSLSVPSSPSTPRPEKKTNLTESAMMLKLAQIKQPPSLASSLITATAAIAGKKSKHINLNSDNDDDDEDDEELMDI